MSRLNTLVIMGIVAAFLEGCSSSLQDNSGNSQPFSEQSRSSQSMNSGLKVGVLLPLTGPHQALGEALQKAAEVAYFKGLKDQGLILVFEDTAGTASGARQALEKLVRQQVKVILGPVFAPEAQALKNGGPGRKIPIFSLSNHQESAGGQVFVLGLNPVDQMRQSLEYAASRGVRSLIAILPNSEYGHQLRQKLPRVASRLRLTLKGIKSYSSHNPYDYGTIDWKAVDGIFIPEGAPNGMKVLESLFHQGMDPSRVRIIGSSLWEGMSSLPEGGIYAAPDTEARDKVLQIFTTYNGAPLPKITVLLYDGLFLIASLNKAFPEGAFDQKNLVQTQGFMGNEGAFRLTSQGYTERLMAIYEIIQGRPQKVRAPLAGFNP